MVKGNPFKDDPKVIALLQELDSVSTRRQFRRWKKSFLSVFEVYLEERGTHKVRAAYRELCRILSRHVELVKKMHAHIQGGDLSPEGCTVRSRQSLGNFFDQMIRVKQVLIDLLPTTANMEKRVGYTKFHLAAVLIDNGFVAYDRLSLCDEIHCHFKTWCLQDVANKLFLLEMDHYHNQLDIFCDILADLGLKGTAEKCLKFLHLDDEETIIWEGGDDSISDCSYDDSGSEEEVDMDPLPDLSDITFDDEASLNLPLWKVNDFYRDNAEMAETFRNDMRRKSFQMFNDSGHGRSQRPPSMPRRTSDRDVSLSAPTKPRRTLSNEGFDAAGKLDVPPPTPTMPQRTLSNERIEVADSEISQDKYTAPGVPIKQKRKSSKATTIEDDIASTSVPAKPTRRLSFDRNAGESPVQVKPKDSTAKDKKRSPVQRGKSSELDDTKRMGNRAKNLSNRTMETEGPSDSDSDADEKRKGETASIDRRSSLKRADTKRFIPSYLPMPKGKITPKSSKKTFVDALPEKSPAEKRSWF